MTRWRNFSQRIWALGILLACLFVAGLPVQAQNGFTLAVDPLISQVPVGTELVLELVIEEGVDLNAFDLTVRFNPDVLSLKTWDYGDYFANLASMTVVTETNSIRVAATQVASDPVSGEGTVLELTFTADVEGFSSIDIIQAEFADADGNKLEPAVVNGQVTVTLDPTFTPTVTATPTATRTSTLTRTPTATVTPTPTVTSTATHTATITHTPTLTPTATEGPTETSTPTPGVTLTPSAGASETDAPPAPTETALVQDSSTPEETPQGEVIETGADEDNQRLLNGLLWGVLIAGIVTFAVLIGLIFRRRNQEEEDLLL